MELRHLQRALKERQEGSWQRFVLEKTPKEFCVPALRACAFVWLRSREPFTCSTMCYVPVYLIAALTVVCIALRAQGGIWRTESKQSLHLNPNSAMPS